MKPGANNERAMPAGRQVYSMAFASVYPHYVTKVEKKGRVIHWLTGYEEKGLAKVIADKTDFEAFPLGRYETSSPRRRACTRTRP
jgi:hypothetical protein